MLAGAARPLAAQAPTSTAGIILEYPANARAVGLGGAYASILGEASTVFLNPAGMAPIRYLALGGSYEEDLFGARLSSAAMATRVGKFSLGFGAMYMDYGGDSVVVPDPATGGLRGTTTGALMTAYNLLGVGALGYRRGFVSLGASAKYLRERVDAGDPDPYSSRGVTGSLGAAIMFFDIASIGVVFENLAGSLTSSSTAPKELPRSTRVGFTANFVDPQGPYRLMTTTDWVSPPGGDSYWIFGVEGGFVPGGMGVVLRTGLVLGRSLSDRQPFSYGASLIVRGLRLDYGFQGYERTGQVSHRFGVKWTP